MWFPITKGNVKRNLHSILEPVGPLECDQLYEKGENSKITDNLNDNYINDIAEHDKNNFDENLDLRNTIMHIAFKDEIIKNKHVIYKYSDLVTISNIIFKDMSIRAFGVSLEIIKKMDEPLWDVIRKIYEKLKKNKEIRFLDIFKTVRKIIKKMYGLNEIEKILTSYDQNISNAVFGIGKLLLSTYHEASIIVTNLDEMSVQEVNKNVLIDKAVQSENILFKCVNDKRKTFVKSKSNYDKYINKKSITSQKSSSLSKRKRYTAELSTRRPAIKPIKFNVQKELSRSVIKMPLQENFYTNTPVHSLIRTQKKHVPSVDKKDKKNDTNIAEDTTDDDDDEDSDDICDVDVNPVTYYVHNVIDRQTLSKLYKAITKVACSYRIKNNAESGFDKWANSEELKKLYLSFVTSLNRYFPFLKCMMRQLIPNVMLLVLYSLCRYYQQPVIIKRRTTSDLFLEMISNIKFRIKHYWTRSSFIRWPL